MKKLKYILTLVVICGCQASSNQQIAENKKEQLDTLVTVIADKVSETETRHCFIKEIYVKNNKTYIDVDYIDFLTGDSAATVARQDGEEDYNIKENGDTSYYVPNDYYISNKNNKIRSLELVKDVYIEIYYFEQTI